MAVAAAVVVLAAVLDVVIVAAVTVLATVSVAVSVTAVVSVVSDFAQTQVVSSALFLPYFVMRPVAHETVGIKKQVSFS
jgi:hypothetical protein